jgi:hypothetical protein
MENPEFTERQINEALKAHTQLDITVQWDGWEPERDQTADFEVYLDGETTDLVVWDHGTSFDIYARTSPRCYTSRGWAVGYDKLAANLTKIIEEAIVAEEKGENV